jgi:hypothetical protein
MISRYSAPFAGPFPFALVLVLAACGGKKPAEQADNTASTTDADAGSSEPTASTDGGADPITGDKPAETKPCEGFEIADLAKTLSQAVCELPAGKGDEKSKDLKGQLEVKIVPSSPKVAAGQKIDLTIFLTNKSTASIPLSFTVDPEPRFIVEVYDAKGKRADNPPGNEPPLPASVSEAPVPERKTAKVTIVTQGTAQIKLSWEAVKYKWASKERAKGAVPGRGYPREAAGPLPKGKYTVRVRMPLIGVFEGVDHEVSEPRVQIEVQ